MNSNRFALLDYLSRHPHPSIRDMVIGTGISTTSVVNYHLDVLLKEGLIEREKLPGTKFFTSRQVGLTNKGWDVLGKKPVCLHCGHLL